MTPREAAERLPVLLAELGLVRAVLGTGDPRRKLSDDDVRDVWRRYAADEPMAGIARLYGVDRTSIRAIIDGRSYAWVEP